MALNLRTVPADVPFLEAIARDWLARGDDPLTISQGLILLPTRRSARSLAETFLRVRDGRATLLPRIAALGGLDEAPLGLTGALDLPPAVEPMQRLAALTRLILGLNGSAGAPRTADRAWLLARELAALMDEAERAGVDLRAKLPGATDGAFAEHWKQTLDFLVIVTEFWPAWLADNGVMNPAARQVALLEAQARAWEDDPPQHPVWIAGTTAGIAAVERLLRVVARMPNGRVVFPYLDLGMPDAAWAKLEPTHPQAGLARLLTGLGATRADVASTVYPVATVPSERFPILSRVLLPAEALHDWMENRAAVDLRHVTRLRATDQQQEARSIALVLREALETPGATAALITPDRNLANRVAAALLRYGIVADDSAGEPLADTPPAVFLRLLVRAVADGLAPVPLLALLKHPLAAAGLHPAACREAARRLETLCLRGPRPAAGLAGLRKAADRNGRPDEATVAFVARLESCLEPVLRFETAMQMPAAGALRALIDAAERLAATTDTPGATRLWGAEEGEALSTRLGELGDAAALLPDLHRGVLPGLLDAVLQGEVVRSRRAVRGRGGSEHPRIFIWGLLEARLQAVDVAVLGGLAETVWPPVADPGPWLSRPMRQKIGFPAPEEAVGQAAHDFLAACCCAPNVVLSCPERRDNAPAVPARWLTRLDMFMAGRSADWHDHPAAARAAAIDLPAGPPSPVRPPAPCPPVLKRPRRLGVTAIETWLRDPYAIHARYILKLAPLKPLDEETDASDYGSIVHDGLHRFLLAHGANWPGDAAEQLRRAMQRALGRGDLRPALLAWWTPRLERIADWVAATETARRADRAPVALTSEASGETALIRPGGRFVLSGRADRIERYDDGTLAILDYKTGTPPSQKEVDAGLAPQLLLEAMMAADGGFGEDWRAAAGALIYWKLSGGFEAGEKKPLFDKRAAEVPDAVDNARERLGDLIDTFDQPDRTYLSQPNPGVAPRYTDYAQLARVAEWSSAGDGDE